MTFPIFIPPTHPWMFNRWLMLRDEGIPIDVIFGKNYIGAGVVATMPHTHRGEVQVSNYNDCVPPSYPDGVWFTISATKTFSNFPGATYSNRVYIDNTWTVDFQTSHSDWYQWSSDRVYSYTSGSCAGAGMYYYFETTSVFNNSELCSTSSPAARDNKYYIKVHGEHWSGGPPQVPSYSTYQSYGYDIIRAGCSTHTDGGVDTSQWKDKNWNSQMLVLYPLIYPWHLKFFILGSAGAIAGLGHTTTAYIKFTNHPQFHIPPEYQ